MKLSNIALALILMASVCMAATVPDYNGYVNDYANVLGNANVLESQLEELESNTSVEFVVVTLSELPADETMETYAYKIFNTWGIGKSASDNGLLFLMVANGTPGSRMRIEVGYGLEGDIPDAAAGRILDAALPYYEEGDYSTAAQTVVSEVKNRLEGNYSYENGNYSISDDMAIALSVLLLLLPVLIPLFFIIVIASIAASVTRCPKCGSINVKCKDDFCTCQNCKYSFRKKKKRVWPYVAAGGMGSGGWGGGGFGGGGFGGGGSGGGGAGR